MCGITGYVGADLSRHLPEMVGLLEHRGPDDEGTHVARNVGLAMRRLAIIGIESGHQPMFGGDGSIVLVFNGEIYNYIEVRKQLKEKGHKFSTESDTEIIVRLYEEYGEQFLQHLRGMFAIALWDAKLQTLFLARDRIGEKPLFYCCTDDTLVFGSEIKSILPAINSRTANPAAIGDFFSLGFVSGDRTFFDGIQKLPAGSVLTWKDGRHSIKKYWSLQSSVDDSLPFQEARDNLLAELGNAVRLCLRSDVEVAAFLSGGLDSSLLSALAVQSGANLQTFSVGYAGEASGFNELQHARSVADYLGTKHHELILSAESNLSLLPRMLWHFDEPHGEPTSILVYQLCEFVSQRVKVALGGTGGDELFFGYPRHKGIRYQSMYHYLPKVLRSFFRYAFLSISRESTTGGKTAKRIRKFLEGAEKPTKEAYCDWIRLCSKDISDSIIHQGFLLSTKQAAIPPLVDKHLNDRFSYDELMSAVLELDIGGYLPEYQLAYMDRMSMANSLEVRSPLCDYKIVELAASFPADYKLRRLTSKHILKSAARTLIPDQIIDRPKVGFDSPIGQWFKSDLKEFLLAFLGPGQVGETGIFEPAGIANVLDMHMSGRRDFSLLIWSVLAVETWHRMYIESDNWNTPDVPIAELRGGSE